MRCRPAFRTPSSLVVLLMCLAGGCVRPGVKRPPTPPAPVVVTEAVVKTMPMQIRSIGSVKPVSVYYVKPRVSGELVGVHFVEGQDVRRGEKLFTIDPRPYETAMERAAASLDKNRAILHGAQLDLDRIQRAVLTGVASREDLDQAQTAVASARASVAADEATLESARLQLSFTTIRSPIDGRTGEVRVTPGNLVSPTDTTPLAVVVQITPIDVVFALPEYLLPQVERARQKRRLWVMVYPRNGEPPVEGVLSFSDNTVDTTTGTIQLKASVANEDRSLWPGQFVDVVLTVGLRPNSVVVPATAVQTGQAGPYVYLIRPDMKAELRPVEIAFQLSGEAVIASGLTGGEQVVVEGQLRLAPGVPVEVKEVRPALPILPELCVAPLPRLVEESTR